MATYRKMLVTAFTKFAKQWEDSSKTHQGLRRYGFRSARDWGRQMVGNYYYHNGELACDFLLEEIEKAILSDEPITQEFFDSFAQEELSAW